MVNQNDHERELTSTGVREALMIGAHLFKEKIALDIIMSSTANRARTTAGLIADALKIDIDCVSPQDELYEASTRTFLQFVNQLEDHQQHIMCVGHNPVISYLAEYLSGAEVGDMVPAGLAIIRFGVNSWKEAGQGNGELDSYITPEMLER